MNLDIEPLEFNGNWNLSPSIENTDHIQIKEKYGLCLLYTSPSPRDRTRSRMPSSA